MLKVFLGCMVSVVVLLSSVYVPLVVPRTYAASASVLMTHIQAGGVSAATQEFIVLYNNADEKVDISGWCVTNKSSAIIGCFQAPDVGQALSLPAHKHAVIASSSLAMMLPEGTVTLVYTPTNQSSGSITGSSDTISLLDNVGNVVDRQSWTTPLSSGMQFERYATGIPPFYQDTDASADWTITTVGTLPEDETEIDVITVDACPNVEGVQTLVPTGQELSLEGECITTVITPLDVTEILPNAVGSDDGKEFIELFNPNDFTVDLTNYRLDVGTSLEAGYAFPTGSVIQPQSYLSFTNGEITFSLLNTSSRVALIVAKDGQVISEVPAYHDPADGESWAKINEEWVYTNQPTPSVANLPYDDTVANSETNSPPQPCALNQYRSPETNRCRLINVTMGSVTPCKDGQYRSEETNRCRAIATDVKIITPCDEDEERNPATNRCRKIVVAGTPAPCKQGQERNPDTNRCRTITNMPSADYGVLGAETKSSGNWYAWAAVGGVLLLAVCYAIWEWHEEMGKFLRKLFQRALRFARLRK